MQNNLKVKHVILTDISDFYAIINFHRLENLLDEVAPTHGASGLAETDESGFGIPIGPWACESGACA
jgi:hypothetical protein